MARYAEKVAEAGMEPIREAGFEKHLLTRLGHGEGLNYHEKPDITTKSLWGDMGSEYTQFKLEKGMIMVLHPSFQVALKILRRNVLYMLRLVL